MDKNEELLQAQTLWHDKCYAALKREYDNDESKGRLSCAFGFGLSKHYIDSGKKIMVIGQEANDHSFDIAKWGAKNWQKWAIAYFDFQVYGEQTAGYEFSKNNSPFWQFMSKLTARSIGGGLCWNNLDKVRRYVNGQTWMETKLPYDKKARDNCERKLLNEKIFEGKSLLQKEIEIAEPNAVIFAVGPTNPYYHTLCDAFFDGEGAYERLLDGGYPSLAENGGVVEISAKLGLKMPAYYIYHPNYLQMRGRLDIVVDDIARELNASRPLH